MTPDTEIKNHLDTAAVVLRVQDLQVQIGRTPILCGVNLSLRAGEWMGLIGANGAGKTTLLHVLSGAVAAQTGSILLGGREVTRSSVQTRHALGLARSFQRSQFFAQLSVREHFALVRSYTKGRTLRGSEIEAQIEAWGFLAQVNTPSAHLTYPHQRLLDLALALASGPRVLLLDEPSAGLTPEERSRMLQHVASHHASGCAVLMVEHDMELVTAHSQRIAQMEQGRIVRCD